MSRPRSSDPYVVSAKTCSGCIYYGPLHVSSQHSIKCCNYLYDTGNARPEGETCAECSVKQIGKRQRPKVQINIDHSEAGIRRYREKMGIVPKKRDSSEIYLEDLRFLGDIVTSPDDLEEQLQKNQ